MTVAEMLILVDAAIAAWLTNGVLSPLYYRIGDYTIDKRAPLEFLLKLKEMLTAQVDAEPIEEVTIYDDPDI